MFFFLPTFKLLSARLSDVSLVSAGPVCESHRATLQTQVPPKAPHMSSEQTNSSPSMSGKKRKYKT